MFSVIIISGIINRVNVFECFISGARDGLSAAIKILPSLIALLTAISMFRASGVFEAITDFLSPLFLKINFPSEVFPLALMRPVSGSGALAIVNELMEQYGPDSLIGRTVSVMMGSTETTFYTLAVYFGCIGIKNTRYTLKASLLADLAGFLASVYAVRIFFNI